MAFYLSENSKKNRAGCRPELIEISDRAIQITLVDFGHGPDAGLRTDERQHELYSEDASKADGYNDRSFHQANEDGKSDALDFYAFVDGRASWMPEHLAMVAAAFLQATAELGYVIEWGGLWRSARGGIYGWDMPHIQFIRSLKDA